MSNFEVNNSRKGIPNFKSDKRDMIKIAVDKIIAEKSFKGKKKLKEQARLGKLFREHLKDISDIILESKEGFLLDQGTGLLRLQRFLPAKKKYIDWPKTNNFYRKNGYYNFIYHDNRHTNGWIVGLCYKTYYHSTKRLTYALYRNMDLRSFETARRFRVKISNSFRNKPIDYFTENNFENDKYSKQQQEDNI